MLLTIFRKVMLVNVFNRIVVILILLFLIFISVLGIINAFVGFFRWSDIAMQVFDPQVTVVPFVSALALLFVLALSIFLLVMEFYRPKSGVAMIYRVKEGNAKITLESIAQQIRASAQDVEGVTDMDIKIKPKSKGIINNMWVSLTEDVNIPQKMEEIIRAAQDTATKKLGIKILKTNLTIVGLAEGSRRTETEVEEEQGKPPQKT